MSNTYQALVCCVIQGRDGNASGLRQCGDCSCPVGGATNAFNSINWKIGQHNISMSIPCPSSVQHLSSPVRCVIQGRDSPFMAMSPMCAHEAAPVASSAYQTCFTAGQCDCKLSIRIFTATAYIAMASWSPWAKILDKAKDVYWHKYQHHCRGKMPPWSSHRKQKVH